MGERVGRERAATPSCSWAPSTVLVTVLHALVWHRLLLLAQP